MNSQNFASRNVAELLADLMDIVADASTMCASVNITVAEAERLKECSRRFLETLSKVQNSLHDQAKKQGGDDVSLPMSNQSYAQREELEVRETFFD